MEDEEDDLYGSNNAGADEESHKANVLAAVKSEANGQQDEYGDVEDDDEGEDIEEDSDSDIDIITERKPGTTSEAPHDSRLQSVKREESARLASSDKSKGKTEPSAQPAIVKTEGASISSVPQKPGHEYPEVHTSDVNVDHVPTYDATGKLITEIDLDSDLAELDKPWRRPGSDQSDYFNYGFDEFSWTMYCLKQKSMRDTITDQKAESAKFEMMFSGIPAMPGMPGGGGVGNGTPQHQPGGQQQQQQSQQQQSQQQQGPGGGMPGMPGMPDMTPDMMNQMMQQMMASGIDPSQMDFNMFMQQFNQMQQPPQGPQQQQQQQQQGGGAGGGPGAMGYGGGGGDPGLGQGQGPNQQQGPRGNQGYNQNRGGRQGRRW